MDSGFDAAHRPEMTVKLLPRYRARALAEVALHHHRIQPAAELQADNGMGADHLDASPGVDADRSGIGGIADHRDQLTEAARFAFGDQPLQQHKTDAAAMK